GRTQGHGPPAQLASARRPGPEHGARSGPHRGLHRWRSRYGVLRPGRGTDLGGAALVRRPGAARRTGRPVNTGAAIAAVLLCALAALPWSCTLGPSRRRSRVETAGRDRASTRVDEAVLLDLMRSALTAGAGLPRALDAVARAVPHQQGAPLRAVGAA